MLLIISKSTDTHFHIIYPSFYQVLFGLDTDLCAQREIFAVTKFMGQSIKELEKYVASTFDTG